MPPRHLHDETFAVMIHRMAVHGPDWKASHTGSRAEGDGAKAAKGTHALDALQSLLHQAT